MGNLQSKMLSVKPALKAQAPPLSVSLLALTLQNQSLQKRKKRKYKKVVETQETPWDPNDLNAHEKKRNNF